MRKLFVYMTMSLDGFVAGPNNPLDWMVPVTRPGAEHRHHRSVPHRRRGNRGVSDLHRDSTLPRAW